ncbi:DUF309 domain-containing protein [Neobacillus mesonae]|uniref:DUF309 domain-containing protein n=1 Tax=Neobacillus mesonae TaxID=1193713 RepID=UPI00204026A3|nr:DUF309 domain-containing protein [Neobacillus mesonae]MCM3566735.1 DUF309 domain-containing protein [Neobacillus mesonae]
MYPQEYIEYLIHFHGDRDYFECHEILEDYWKKVDFGNKDSLWVGLILLAVSTYHHRRKNLIGAKRTLEKAIMIFKNHSALLPKIGLNEAVFLPLLTERLEMIEHKQTYTSFSFPFNDSSLVEICSQTCRERGLVWGKESDLANEQLVHRHKLRDRTDVIEERKKMLIMKKGSKK